MPYRILVVCTGNICRSPMGEIVLREKLAQAGLTQIVVTSAGVSSEEHGNPIDSRAQYVLSQAGYALPDKHCAHRASDYELQEADLILAMTVGHARALKPMLLTAGTDLAKVHLWREFDGTISVYPTGVYGTGAVLDPAGTNSGKRNRYSDFYTSDGELDVLDPWYGNTSNFQDTLTVVEAGATGIVNWLVKQLNSVQ